jgi:hypothetical protein
MVDLKKIHRGRRSMPPRVLIYGFDGTGKTTFAIKAPKAFTIDADRGSHKFDIGESVTPDTWTEFIDWLTAIEAGHVKCESVVLDSITRLETMLHESIFSGTTIDEFGGGYGRGDTYAVNKWREVLAQLERLWEKGKTIVMVAHAQVKAFSDPTGPSFDRFEIACRPKLAAALRQWTDHVLFCREEVVTAGKKNEKRAATTGVRYAYTRRCPAFDAKARASLMFPERILLSWQSFADELKKDETRDADMREEIRAMLSEIADKTLDTQVDAFLKEHPESILDARNRVAEKLDEHRKNAAPAAS